MGSSKQILAELTIRIPHPEEDRGKRIQRPNLLQGALVQFAPDSISRATREKKKKPLCQRIPSSEFLAGLRHWERLFSGPSLWAQPLAAAFFHRLTVVLKGGPV